MNINYFSNTIINLESKLDCADKVLFNRAIYTLFNNIIDSEGLERKVFGERIGMSPSPRKYKGVWNWDSAFHLMAMTHLNKEIGYDQIRILFDYQKDNGQIADVVFSNGKTVFKFTKPPVLAYYIMCSDIVAPNKNFLEYCYPYLIKNLNWWEVNRFDGKLFSYKISKMESGWDNTVRFDFPHNISWCYAIDCNCFMVSFYDAMTFIARRLNLPEDEKIYANKKNILINEINTHLFDKQNKWFSDYNKLLKKFTGRVSPASFLPMFFGFATKEQAEAMEELAESPDYFYNGIPTISYNNKRFNPNGYWRGPCWLNTAFFTIKGLDNYGYHNLAKEINQNILDFCTHNSDSIYEYYNPITGKGLGAKDFGWSCAFIIEMLLFKYS